MSFAFIHQDRDALRSRKILVFGYIRQTYPSYIPHDIMKLFYDYSKDSVTWKISHQEFMLFQNKAEQSVDDWNYEILLGPIFTIRGFEFECNIASASHAQFLQFQLRLKSMHQSNKHKDNIQSIIAYYEVSCSETKSSEKDTKMLNKIGDGMSWPTYNLQVKECINLHSFTFEIYVDIFKINYKKNNKSIHKNDKISPFTNDKYESLSLSILRNTHYRPIKMYSHIKYSWKINNHLLQQFKHSHFGKYWYSPNFGLDGTEENGDNFAWCLYITPHGYNYTMNDKVYIGIVLLNLPPKIKMIEINFTMKCHLPLKDIVHQDGSKIMHYKYNCATWPGSVDFTPTDLKNIKNGESVEISIQIDIVRVVTDKGIEVKRNEWEYFGIITKPVWPRLDVSKSFSWLQYLHQR